MKSSYSQDRAMCVDVVLSKDCLADDCAVHVTDSKTGSRSPMLHFTRDEWDAFVRGVKAGEFDVARMRSLNDVAAL